MNQKMINRSFFIKFDLLILSMDPTNLLFSFYFNKSPLSFRESLQFDLSSNFEQSQSRSKSIKFFLKLFWWRSSTVHLDKILLPNLASKANRNLVDFILVQLMSGLIRPTDQCIDAFLIKLWSSCEDLFRPFFLSWYLFFCIPIDRWEMDSSFCNLVFRPVSNH